MTRPASMPPDDVTRIAEVRLEVERILSHMARAQRSKWAINRGQWVLRALTDWQAALTTEEGPGG